MDRETRIRLQGNNVLDEVFGDTPKTATINIPFGELVTLPILKQIAERFEVTVKKCKGSYFDLTGTPENLFWMGCNFERKLTEAIYGSTNFPGLLKV